MKQSEIDLPKLHIAMKRDYAVLQVFRENRMDHIREFAGGNYALSPKDQGNDKLQKPVNLTSLFVRTMGGYLIGAEPRMMASTSKRELRPLVSAMEEWSNRKLQELSFGEVMSETVLDALFLMGIVRVALTAPAESRFGGYERQPGEVSLTRIDFEDFGFDTHAKRFKECDYLWHRYRVLHEDVKRSTLFPKKARLKIVPKRDELYNPGGDERVLSLSRGGSVDEEYREYVELIECYFPREQRVVTFEADDPQDILLDQDWVGPKCGPYHFLRFARVPGQLIPKGPIMDLINLDRSSNMLWRKLDYQASKQKQVTVFQDADDAKKHQEAKDGEWVQSNRPDGVKEVRSGGPDQATGIWAIQEIELFKKMAGNLDALGGLGSQADTATQEKLIAQNASTLVQAMSKDVVKLGHEVMQSLGWFFWHNPWDDMTSTYQAPGVPDIGIERRVSPMDRIGQPFEDLDIRMDPYSVTYQTPQQRLAVINQMVKETFIPFLPMFSQPGVGGLLEAYVRMVAKYTNNPDLLELLEHLIGIGGGTEQSEQGQGQPGMEKPGMPNETTRTYERVSRPGRTDEGQQQLLQQMMAASNGQGNENFASRAG